LSSKLTTGTEDKYSITKERIGKAVEVKIPYSI
jgi:hypothetical protein